MGLALIGAVSGCSLPERRADFDSIDPSERTLALARAAAAPDERMVDRLIVMLDSDDPAERMLAIRALENSTGETFGYHYAASEASRRAAVQRWVEWRRSRDDPAVAPASSGGSSAQ